MKQAPDGWMTIEALSVRSGVTTRNIRAYQSRGLLPRPVTRPGSRAAHYTPEHLGRLRLVSRLQERGFSLAGIADLLHAWAGGKSVEHLLGMEFAAVASTDDPPRAITERELRALVPASVDFEATLHRLLAVGLIDRYGRRYRVRHPRMFDLGLEAVRAGVPPEALLDELVRLHADLHDIALRFVAMFAKNVLLPFVEAGSRPDKLSGIVDQMQRLRLLAVEATTALMRQAIADEIEAATRESVPRS